MLQKSANKAVLERSAIETPHPLQVFLVVCDFYYAVRSRSAQQANGEPKIALWTT
jgi:hypothetical protein